MEKKLKSKAKELLEDIVETTVRVDDIIADIEQALNN